MVRDKTDDGPRRIDVGRHGPAAVRRASNRRPRPGVRCQITAQHSDSCTTDPKGPEPDASGHRGFFYHFLDIETGRRVWQCELSTIDSAFLFAGALTAAAYFDRDTADEAEIRRRADILYRRADWNWARDGGPTADSRMATRDRLSSATAGKATTRACSSHPRPGSPSHPLPAESFGAYLRNR